MAKWTKTKFAVVSVSMDIDLLNEIHDRALGRIGKRVSEFARQVILDRLDRGEFPSGSFGFSKPTYSTNYLVKPTFPSRNPYRGPTYERRYKQLGARMRGQKWDGRKGPSRGDRPAQHRASTERRYVEYPGGYRQFKEQVTGRGDIVDLNVTGKLREDLEVKHFINSAAGGTVSGLKLSSGAAKSLKRSDEGQKVFGMRLKVGFTTKSSQQIARHLQTQGYDFARWNLEEKIEIREFASGLLNDVPRGGAKTNKYGSVVPGVGRDPVTGTFVSLSKSNVSADRA